MSATKNSAATRLHILVLDPAFHHDDRPGPARTATLCDELARAGHRVTILTALPEQSSNESIKIISLGNGAQVPFGQLASARTFRSYLIRVSWRIWHVENVNIVVVADTARGALPVATAFCAIRGVPLVIDARKGLPRNPPAPSLAQRITTTIKRVLYRRAAHSARRIIVQNINLKNALVEDGVVERKIVETSAGCDCEILRSATDTPESPGPTIVYAGRIDLDSGFEQIVDVARATQSILSNAVFMICGDGSGRKQLEEYAKRTGALNACVRVLDPVPRSELHNVLSPASAVIGRVQHSYDWSPSGHVLDALAAGRPVIFFGTNPHRELIVSRGAGLALPTEGALAAASELSDFLSNGDGLRRAREQAAALAAGRLSSDRVNADIRTAIESAENEAPRRMVKRRRTLRVKRIFDIVFSLSALVIFSPALVGLAIAVQVKMGSPIVFSQERPGLKGKLFRLYKFRTMTNDVNTAGASLPDGDRLMPLGKFMRRTSLDELPELFNVLAGDMSLVGPRPLLPEYLPFYSVEQKRRHDVLPGLTGWTQINGRNALEWEDKFALDVWYVDNLSLSLDIKILLKTAWVALRGSGVNAPGHATMPRFDEIMARREGAEDD